MWGGISRKGATQLVIFNGIMDSVFYQDILNQNLIPFIEENFPDSHRFMQDNDPKHTSRSTRAWMEEKGINWWHTPAESPDLNPIENVWHALKHHLRRHVKPSNREELIEGIKEFWRGLNPQACNKYIDHLYNVIPVVITRAGEASGF